MPRFKRLPEYDDMNGLQQRRTPCRPWHLGPEPEKLRRDLTLHRSGDPAPDRRHLRYRQTWAGQPISRPGGRLRCAVPFALLRRAAGNSLCPWAGADPVVTPAQRFTVLGQHSALAGWALRGRCRVARPAPQHQRGIPRWLDSGDLRSTRPIRQVGRWAKRLPGRTQPGSRRRRSSRLPATLPAKLGGRLVHSPRERRPEANRRHISGGPTLAYRPAVRARLPAPRRLRAGLPIRPRGARFLGLMEYLAWGASLDQRCPHRLIHAAPSLTRWTAIDERGAWRAAH